MKPERYFSVDIESSGPIPGKYSMLSLGACAVDDPDVAFYVEFKPTSHEFVPEAMRILDLDLDKLQQTGSTPEAGMAEFRNWVEANSVGMRPVFVGFNGCYDWQFVNWYFETYSPHNPFGFGGIDIKSFHMGLTHSSWTESSSNQLRADFRPDTPQTHNALDDAKAQASIFAKMLAFARKR